MVWIDGSYRKSPAKRDSAQTVYNTKRTKSHMQMELIREWLWELKGSSKRTGKHTHTHT